MSAKRSGKKKEPAVSVSLNKTETDGNQLPEWYRISEISPHDFVRSCRDIFTVLEGKHKSKSSEDPFLKGVMIGHYKLSEKDWKISEEVRLKQKVLEMKMGDFHEELMGKFAGYETLPNGHSTGCDVQKKDGSVLLEVKNRDNTVKGSDGKHIIARLKELNQAGKHAIFAQINCPAGVVKRFGASSKDKDIDIWNGKEVYAYLSGRETFYDDLLQTIQYAFANFQTLTALKAGLGIA